MLRSNQPSPVDHALGSPRRESLFRRSAALREMCSSVRVALVVGALSIGGVAHAQGTPQQLAEANRTAMEAYNNLDIEAAKAQLEKAAKGAEKSGIRGPSLARTYSNLAVVLVGGLGDMKGATAAFARALKEDPKVEPDPIVATPEVMQAYNAAKSSLKNAPAPAAEPTTEPEATPPARAPRDTSVSPEGNLDHTPATEQLSQTAIPIFVKKSGDLEIASMRVMYRSTGMKKPKSAEMTETDDGYTYLVPCTDVFEPVVEYFIVAKDDDNKMIGNAGTSDAPISVPIVSVRTEAAPSLPGQVPPAQCASSDDECPPGMPGCGGSGGLGDTCSSDSDCGSGLACDDDTCSMGERASEADEEEESSSGRKRYKKYFVEAAFGMGLTSVGSGRAPDRDAGGVLDTVAMMSRRPDNSIDREKARTLLQARGFDCIATEDDMQRLQVDKCTVAVNPGGMVPVPVLNLALGYYLTPKIAVALTGRFQIGSGDGPLAGILLGGRGEYLLGKPSDKGLRRSALAGLGVGQLQARPPAKGSLQGPYATNANVGGLGVAVNLGA
ncbi:MAG: hypothetical protein RLZZ450_4657, partial [Pseudomonadota bacterium]